MEYSTSILSLMIDIRNCLHIIHDKAQYINGVPDWLGAQFGVDIAAGQIMNLADLAQTKATKVYDYIYDNGIRGEDDGR